MRIFKVAILFSGNGSNMQNLIETLHKKRFSAALDSEKLDSESLDSEISESALESVLESSATFGVEVAITLCNNKDAYGITRLKSLGIPCEVISHRDYPTREDFDNAMLECLRGHGVELCLLAGFMRILSAPFTRSMPLINIHPSFLPAHKGAHAIKDSFEAGRDGGVSVHWVNEELDSGALILQERLEVLPSDTLESFEAKIHALEYTLYPKAVLYALRELCHKETQ